MSGSAWRNLILAVSLLFNVFIVGVAVGGKAAGVRMAGPWTQEPTDRPAPERQFSPRQFVMALPPEHRRNVTRRLMSEGGGSLPMMREARAAGEQALATLSADDFDPDAALAALNTARDAQLRLERRGYEVLVEILNDLPDDVRLETLKQVRRQDDRRTPRRRRRGEAD